MIDFAKEQAISLREAIDVASALRGKERPIHYRTIWRWAAKGQRGIKLESAFIGGERRTTREAIVRFIERLTAIRQDAVEEQSPRHVERRRDRRRDYLTARARLAMEHGI